MQKSQFDEILAAIDAESTRIGAKFTELFTRLQNGGMSPEEEAAVFAEAQRLSTKLAGLGHDPVDPVPNPEPEPEPQPEPEPTTGGGEGESTPGGEQSEG